MTATATVQVPSGSLPAAVPVSSTVHPSVSAPNGTFRAKRGKAECLAVKLDKNHSEYIREVMNEEETSAGSAAEGLVWRGFMVWKEEKAKKAKADSLQTK